VPIEGIVLTDAEIDHSLGLVLLREGKRVPLYATAAVRSVLEYDSRLLPLTRAFAEVPFTELPIGKGVPLLYADRTASGLTVEAFAVPAGPPQFALVAPEGHTVGLVVREINRNRTCIFVPGCGGLTPQLRDRLAQANALLFDGTFWSDNEPVAMGISNRTARQMDHVPIEGPSGSLEQLAGLSCEHRVYTHINNTNPILLEDSPEHASVVHAGLIVGYDGLYITV
jgi:pyrroloquinoline quinone biosynthesis protein B